MTQAQMDEARKAIQTLEQALPRWALIAWRLWCAANRRRWRRKDAQMERDAILKQLMYLNLARGVIGIEWGMIRQGIDPAEECRKRAERWEVN